jgi:hypothetical protein
MPTIAPRHFNCNGFFAQKVSRVRRSGTNHLHHDPSGLSGSVDTLLLGDRENSGGIMFGRRLGDPHNALPPTLFAISLLYADFHLRVRHPSKRQRVHVGPHRRQPSHQLRAVASGQRRQSNARWLQYRSGLYGHPAGRIFSVDQQSSDRRQGSDPNRSRRSLISALA